MGIGIYSALSGMKVKLEELEMVAHNLANANTVGFKERDVAFSSVLAENMKPAGGEEQDTPFVKLEDHSFDLTQGAIFKTGNELDLAIQGDGCSGYQYQYSFDSLRDKDIQIHKDGVTVVIDPLAKDLLNGSLLDYSDDFRNQGFSVSNPNATGTCGCGVSFSV